MKEAIKERARQLGFDDCRVTSAVPPETAPAFERWLQSAQHGMMGYLERNAHKRMDPQQVLAGAKSIIVLAASYTTESQTIPGTGIVARYAQHADYHDLLARPLKELSAFVTILGGPETRSLWYVDTGPILERDLAQRAGLGFAGKHTNLISRKLGNYFFIAEIITTLELDPDPPEKNRCGSCTRCIESCPTSAITGPFQLDARRCISYLTIELKGSIPEELRPAIGNRIYGCDICLEACPWNRFAREGKIMREHRRPDLASPDLVELLSLDDAGFKKRFAGTPMLRTKRRGLLRNVCVALGNTADQRALSALEKASLDPESLIAEHARWAIAEIEKKTTRQREFSATHPPSTESHG